MRPSAAGGESHRQGSGPCRIALAIGLCGILHARGAESRAWHEHHADGLARLAEGDPAGAERELREAIARRAVSSCQARRYGVRFLPYVPHYHLGVALQAQGRNAEAAVAFSRELASGVIGDCAATAGLATDLRARLGELARTAGIPRDPPLAAVAPGSSAAPASPDSSMSPASAQAQAVASVPRGAEESAAPSVTSVPATAGADGVVHVGTPDAPVATAPPSTTAPLREESPAIRAAGQAGHAAGTLLPSGIILRPLLEIRFSPALGIPPMPWGGP